MKNKKLIQQQLVEKWNRGVAVGALVEYRPSRNSPTGKQIRTRSQAWMLGEHTAVVLLEGLSGAVSIEHCTVVTETAPAA